MARLASVLSLLCLTAACTDTSGPSATDQIFAASLARWDASGPASYDMVLVRECVCEEASQTVVVSVRNGQVTGRVFAADGVPVPGPQAGLFPDVPGLFAIVRDALQRDVFYMSTQYDQTFGHPVRIKLNVTATRSDDDLDFSVLDLSPVP